jgi:dolichyl-phosphate-mannose--protein O-mannosyl transferase
MGVISLVFSFKRPQFWQALLFTIGWAVCYFPFFLIPRVMYQYHYCIPLMMGTMAFGAGIDILIPRKLREVLAVTAIILTIWGFWLWSPFVYGTKMHDRAASIWSRTWTEGDHDHAMRRASYYESQRRR